MLNKYLSYILSIFAVTMALVVVVPDWRAAVHTVFLPEKIIVLSTLKSDFFQDGRVLRFSKIKSGNQLFVEIYEDVVTGYQKQFAKIRLPDSNDGYFHFRGQATNLALEDITGDGLPEVLAPSFDINHIAHLNVYTYNATTKTFEMLPPGAANF